MQDLNHNSLKDFFISYNSADRLWAEWIAWQLEEEGYSTVLQAGDFRSGSSFVQEMQKAAKEAERTIVVLSPDYLNALNTQPEWAAVFRRDPTSEQGILLTVHVRECRNRFKGLLELIVYIDLVGHDESTAREMLLAGVHREDSRPKAASSLPGVVHRAVTEQPHFPATLPSIWNVPYQRNPFFTGREDILTYLYETLKADKAVALRQPQAISGLGGIGKTQTAIEYAYRYASDYQAILWAMADSRETLVSDFVAIADLLNLPEKDSRDQRLAVNAVKRWLRNHIDWLLILDNADDLAMVRDFIPSASGGHVLLTTRTQATGRIAQRVDIETMTSEESVLFLLRRANILVADALLDNASAADRATAKKISRVLDGLPLALDQAGAYIEETGCSLSDYLHLYQMQWAELLQRRGASSPDHPESVATTWSLPFDKVQQANSAAAELLRFCAFLYPDAIPQEIITEGASELGPVLEPVVANAVEMDLAIAELLKYSLVRRNPASQTLTIHRLVQAVLKDRMNTRTQRLWAERTVRVVNRAFPDISLATWPRAQRYLPQAQTCAELIERWDMTFPEAARLLNQAGSYLYERAQYAQAEPLMQRALVISEHTLGPQHPGTVSSLSNLASLYYLQGQYDKAEPLMQRALAIREQTLGPNHPHTASSLNNLALLYRIQGQYAQAEPLMQRALAIREQTLGPNHPHTASSLNNLASLYRIQGQYEQAEPLMQRALAISEKILGPDHPDIASNLNNLALLYAGQGKYEQAEPLFQRALAISEKILGPGHPYMVTSLNSLASLYHIQGQYAQAEPLYHRAITIGEQVLGPEHSDVAGSLNNLALLYKAQGRYEEAEPLLTRALGVKEKVLGPEHPEVAQGLNNLALLYYAQGRYEEAEPLFVRALRVREKVLGSEHPDTATSLNNLAELYYAQGRYEEAEPLLTRALGVREKVLGLEHPAVARVVENYTNLLRKTNREVEAAELEATAKTKLTEHGQENPRR